MVAQLPNEIALTVKTERPSIRYFIEPSCLVIAECSSRVALMRRGRPSGRREIATAYPVVNERLDILPGHRRKLNADGRESLPGRGRLKPDRHPTVIGYQGKSAADKRRVGAAVNYFVEGAYELLVWK